MMGDKDLTFQEKFTLFQFMCMYPALTGMMGRQRIGLRVVSATNLYIMTAIITAVGYLTHSKLLDLYALVFWGTGTWQQYNRHKEMRAGAKWHTRSFGISPLEYLPLPKWVVAEDRTYRIAEPLALFGIGLLVLLLDKPLGAWLILSAGCMRVFEEFMYQHRLTRLLDLYDGAIAAEAAAAQQPPDGEDPAASPARRAAPRRQRDPGSIGRSSTAGEELSRPIAERIREAEAAARRNPVAEAIHTVKETAGAVKEAAGAVRETAGAVKDTAEAVSAVRHAAKGPERETVIIARENFTPIAPAPEPIYITAGNGHAAPSLPPHPTRPALPAPPDDADKAA